MKAKKSPAKKAPSSQPLVALTVKIDHDLYKRLSALRAEQRKTAQDILAEALRAYLDESGA